VQRDLIVVGRSRHCNKVEGHSLVVRSYSPGFSGDQRVAKIFKSQNFSSLINTTLAMAERGGRGRGGRGRRGGAPSSMTIMAQRLGTTTSNLRSLQTKFEPEPTFPTFLVPRPTKLSQDEINMVKYYKNIRNKILEETPFYVIGKKRPADDEDDGIAMLGVKADFRDCSVSG